MAERWGEGVRGERHREERMETGDGMREDGGDKMRVTWRGGGRSGDGTPAIKIMLHLKKPCDMQ